MMSARTRIWVFVTVLFCAVLVLGGLLFGLLPKLSAASMTRELAADAARQNELYSAQIQSLQAQRAKVPELKREAAELRAAIPAATRADIWLAQLDALEARSQASLVSVEFSAPAAIGSASEGVDEGAASDRVPPTGAAGQYEVPFRLDVEGTRAQLDEFVNGLQLGSRLVQLGLVEYSGGGDNWRAHLAGKLYVSQ